ncbi:hypothetical protein EDD96_6793 [Streptomyces sp. Ag109_G2-6]|uniref:hypothetical protein n=1 Tax=Streptomyces TaxID=1883 RepID=UPI000F4F52FF|nr:MULTISPECIES: hypothetical protein [Streptomyces]RPF30201.1 hypothetical protein EDD96_6793 [Streptomyces sp. Ag109_G2-6]
MKTTLFKLAALSVIAFAATSTVTIPAQADASSPVPLAEAGKTPGPGWDGPAEEEIGQRAICKVSGILGWFGGMIGGNDVCGDDYDEGGPQPS